MTLLRNSNFDADPRALARLRAARPTNENNEFLWVDDGLNRIERPQDDDRGWNSIGYKHLPSWDWGGYNVVDEIWARNRIEFQLTKRNSIKSNAWPTARWLISRIGFISGIFHPLVAADCMYVVTHECRVQGLPEIHYASLLLCTCATLHRHDLINIANFQFLPQSGSTHYPPPTTFNISLSQNLLHHLCVSLQMYGGPVIVINLSRCCGAHGIFSELYIFSLILLLLLSWIRHQFIHYVGNLETVIWSLARNPTLFVGEIVYLFQ